MLSANRNFQQKKKKGKKEEEERKKKRQYSPANSSCMEVERFQKLIVKYVTFCTQIAFFVLRIS